MIRKALKWGLIGFIALMVIGALLPSEETPKKEQASVNEQQPVASQKKQEKPQQKERPADLKEKMATVGQEVRAGDMLWVVNDAYYTTELPDIFGIDPPKEGNFVVVDFTLTNQRNEAVTLDQSHLILKDSTGNIYQADTDTFSFISVEKDIFLTQINPDILCCRLSVSQLPLWLSFRSPPLAPLWAVGCFTSVTSCLLLSL
jgi:Domain of unknown function (DUF4352)